MKINKAYKFRIYPDKKQIAYIEGCFNACRYVYNVSLDCEQQLYMLGGKSNLSSFGLSYHLKYYKIKDTWLNDYDSLALEMEMEFLSNAYEKFFKGGGFPKFKSKKDSKQSFSTRIIGANLKLTTNSIKIPKVKKHIKCIVHRDIEGKIKKMTIARENNKYFVSIMVEIEKDIKPINVVNEVGIDLGLNNLAILDDGTKIDNPKFLGEAKEYLKLLQQKLSRAKRGSNNHLKLKKQISNLHEKIKNKRNLYLHEETKKVVDTYDRFYVEDLNVKGMSASSKGTAEEHGSMVKQKSGLNRNILDSGLSTFVTMLTYKGKFSGKEVIKVNRFFASSKTCSSCGFKNDELLLSDRTWICTSCGMEHDRDINAARNIKAEGRRSLTKV